MPTNTETTTAACVAAVVAAAIVNNSSPTITPMLQILPLQILPLPPRYLIRRNKKNGELLSRATNEFLIYRNEYSKELSKQLESCGCNKLSMRKVSRMTAMAWKTESREVKRKYEKIHVKLLLFQK
ncbi:hypothetical protein Glove_74g320 [Diversispora epigaea]|uniref:Uncharacterized protein n=1 Tax=Diversispora epigaea TaxID=1348612 RepID=A0A397J9C5_9GLOM|nr:hypothetical protein Glove_74g320 [Diversispora epigaea]